MTKTYEVYQKKTTRNLLILFSSGMTSIGVMLFLSSIGRLEWLNEFLQGSNAKFAFIRHSAGQLILGSVTAALFAWLWFKTVVSIFKNKPILVADDFGLEVNRIAKYNIIAWAYIDGITIENYAKSNSQGKRPTLIIRYRDETNKKQKSEIFIPIRTLAEKPKLILDGLNARNKGLKF
ncbi:MAG: hypothetical protein L3J65_09885 [Robiginitomaculum sp.]|nr:hypothetical protein [Robiginitomaculum sp.]